MSRRPLPVDWEAIKARAIAGETPEALGAEYGIRSGTIRQRIYQQSWPVPFTLIRRARQILKQQGKLGKSNKQASKEIHERAALSLAERGTIIGTHALGLIEASVLTRKKGFELESVRDLKTAVDVAWKVTGKDQAATSVSVTVNGLHALPGPLHTPSVIMDAESVDLKDSGEGEDA